MGEIRMGGDAKPMTDFDIMHRASMGLQLDFPLSTSTVALYRIGSHSHGTHIPPDDPHGIDDTDYMLIVAPPRHRVYGLRRFEHADLKVDELDLVVYSWDKYIRLLLKSNPNVLGTLWLDSEDVGIVTFGAWSLLNEHRASFLSKFVYTTFVGYARGQLKKMTHHAHEGYMGAKRKALVAEHGYDTKNAAHLIRLLRTGCEALKEGVIHVRRPDAAEIVSIKRGEWTLERVQTESDRLFSSIASVYGQSKLPEYPDERLAESILLQGYENMWRSEPPFVSAEAISRPSPVRIGP